MKTIVLFISVLMVTCSAWSQEIASDTATRELQYLNEADKYLESSSTFNGIKLGIDVSTTIASNTFLKKAEKALLTSRKGVHLNFSKNGVGVAYNLGNRH